MSQRHVKLYFYSLKIDGQKQISIITGAWQKSEENYDLLIKNALNSPSFMVFKHLKSIESLN